MIGSKIFVLPRTLGNTSYIHFSFCVSYRYEAIPERSVRQRYDPRVSGVVSPVSYFSLVLIYRRRHGRRDKSGWFGTRLPKSFEKVVFE